MIQLMSYFLFGSITIQVILFKSCVTSFYLYFYIHACVCVWGGVHLCCALKLHLEEEDNLVCVTAYFPHNCIEQHSTQTCKSAQFVTSYDPFFLHTDKGIPQPLLGKQSNLIIALLLVSDGFNNIVQEKFFYIKSLVISLCVCVCVHVCVCV